MKGMPNAQRMINEAVVKLSEDRKAAERWFQLASAVRGQAWEFHSGSPYMDAPDRDRLPILKNGIPDDYMNFIFHASYTDADSASVSGWSVAGLTLHRWVNLSPDCRDWCEMWVYVHLKDDNGKDQGVDSVCLKRGSVLADDFDPHDWKMALHDFLEKRLGMGRS